MSKSLNFNSSSLSQSDPIVEINADGIPRLVPNSIDPSNGMPMIGNYYVSHYDADLGRPLVFIPHPEADESYGKPNMVSETEYSKNPMYFHFSKKQTEVLRRDLKHLTYDKYSEIVRIFAHNALGFMELVMTFRGVGSHEGEIKHLIRMKEEDFRIFHFKPEIAKCDLSENGDAKISKVVELEIKEMLKSLGGAVQLDSTDVVVLPPKDEIVLCLSNDGVTRFY